MRSFFLLLFLFANTRAYAIAFNMAPLEFSNRAGCADLSTKPARSVFLQLDSFNAGKAGFAQGLIAQRGDQKIDPSTVAQKSAKDFRLWSTHLAYEIIEALKTGRLPLLDQEGLTPSIYKTSADKCLSKRQFLSCSVMNDLLSELWSRSKMKTPNWQELGLTQDDFFPSSLQPTTTLGCHIVRKFSSFHSPLQTPIVEKGTITNIAIEAFRPSESLDSCFSIADGKDPRFTTVQFDIANLDDEANWNAIGFKFWHSFKLFYSWGWRYAPEYLQEYGSLKQAFSSIAFEDSAMLLPNGCRSVESPKCDSTGLSTDVLRAAKFLGATHPAMSELPPKPIDMLFSGKAQSVNDDSMGLFKAENASAWSRDFKEKLSGIRFDMQRKINAGLGKLQVITTLVGPEDLSKDIMGILKNPNYDRIETYLACMEYTLAKNNLFNDIDAEIQTLDKSEELKSVLLADSGKNLVQYVDYYKALTNTMGAFCKSLEDNGRAAPDTKNPELLNP